MMSHIKGQVNTTQRGYSCQHWQTNSPHEVKIKPKNDAIEWYDIIWHGMLWYGMLQNDMVAYGML